MSDLHDELLDDEDELDDAPLDLGEDDEDPLAVDESEDAELRRFGMHTEDDAPEPETF